MNVNQTIKLGITVLSLLIAPTLVRPANAQVLVPDKHRDGLNGNAGINLVIKLENDNPNNQPVKNTNINKILNRRVSNLSRLTSPPG